MNQWVFKFGDGSADGHADMKNLLGGKGANLAEMCRLGLPVPPGFTITTDVCSAFYDNDHSFPEGVVDQVRDAIGWLESVAGKRFGDPANPLLVSVRSGGRASMPGMMDTVLNLGINDDTVKGLAVLSDDQAFVWDSYRRFIQMYGDVVLGVDHHHFEEVLDILKEEEDLFRDTDLEAHHWEELVSRYKQLVQDETGKPFPQDVNDQLWGAIDAVFGSWQNNRAIAYRRLNNIPDAWGTAVNVQAMVFGNRGDDSATGVAFTRNPSTGEDELFGEFLINAQGEDVVAGIRTPQHLTISAKQAAGSDKPALEEVMPEIFTELTDVFHKLEAHYRDMQDIEFTVEGGKLWMLQTRSGKRTANAALRIAVEMVEAGIITEQEAIMRVDALALDQLLHPKLDPSVKPDVLVRGLPASPGAASGVAVFSSLEAERRAKKGEDVILVRHETSPEDIQGMHAASGILTSRGGMTSHAAVVARGMGRACVVGAGSLKIDERARCFKVLGETIHEGDLITIDGSTGSVMKGRLPTIEPELTGHFAILMDWADKVRKLQIRTNAETLEDAEMALKFGAEGIGLSRTEHMFFEADRIVAMREMILAVDKPARERALAKLLPMQRQDFVELFTVMQGKPVTIRLLDPPLHEFLPHVDEEIEEIANDEGISPDLVRSRSEALRETNPMLGHRGCRLAISYPEIVEMQVRAIISAAVEAGRATGAPVTPEIMVPLVGSARELEIVKFYIDTVADKIRAEADIEFEYMVGTMIELPRAALQAKEIAGMAGFFSFGTNDLTQTTLGISRDDAGSFMRDYVDQGIFNSDPFVTLDIEGVGELIKIAAERGREQKPNIKLGICGEHGGDPASIRFVAGLGLDYVSCSPYRVPIARLAAAQAALAASSISRE